MGKARVAINGFGRIGRLLLRYGLGNPNLEFVAINDVADLRVLAYLFKYDSAYGPFEGTVIVEDKALVINGKPIRFCSEKDPAALPWGDMKVDYAVESTGIFIDTGKPEVDPRKHLKAGARRVVVSAPAKTDEDVKTFVLGVNHREFDPAKHTVISNASCTTNCLAPVVKVVNDNWGIENGLMTTVHAMTASQKTVDSPSRISKGLDDVADNLKVRSGRAAGNIIPAKTGAAAAIALAIPAVKGKLTGMAFRVPTLTGSVVDLTVLLQRETTLEEIGKKMEEAANTPLEDGGLKGCMGFTRDPFVSSDIVGSRLGSMFDYYACLPQKGSTRFFKLVSWYDNEAGYTNRLVDMLAYMAGRE